MAIASGNKVRFAYAAATASLPSSRQEDTIYFDAQAQKLYVGAALIANNVDVAISGTGDCVTGATFANNTLTLTMGDFPEAAFGFATIGGAAATQAGDTLTFTEGDNVTITQSGKDITFAAVDTTYDPVVAASQTPGLMTGADKSKLDGIEAGAEVNQNAFSSATAGGVTISAAQAEDTIGFVAGSNVTLTGDATNKTVTIAATDTTYDPVVAGSATPGLMTGADKTKLDGIAAGAEVNVQADWDESDSTSDAFILNKPTNVSEFTNDAGYLTDADLPEYTVTAQTTPDTGDKYTYQLFKDSVATGDKIHVPVDSVIKSGTIETVTVADQPYPGAKVGDKYIDIVIENQTDHLYIPANALVDEYTAGNLIDITNRVVSHQTVASNVPTLGTDDATHIHVSGQVTVDSYGHVTAVADKDIYSLVQAVAQAENTTYTAGTGITLSGTEFSADTSVMATKQYVDDQCVWEVL